MLTQGEAEKIADRLQATLDGKKLKDMYSSKDRTQYAKNLLVPLIEDQTSKRKKVVTPTDEQVCSCL